MTTLFDNKTHYYRENIARLTQSLPQHVAEIQNFNDVLTAFILPPFTFNKGAIKMVDRHIQNNKSEFNMGY